MKLLNPSCDVLKAWHILQNPVCQQSSVLSDCSGDSLLKDGPLFNLLYHPLQCAKPRAVGAAWWHESLMRKISCRYWIFNEMAADRIISAPPHSSCHVQSLSPNPLPEPPLAKEDIFTPTYLPPFFHLSLVFRLRTNHLQQQSSYLWEIAFIASDNKRTVNLKLILLHLI